MAITSNLWAKNIQVLDKTYEVHKFGSIYYLTDNNPSLELSVAKGEVYPRPRLEVDCNNLDRKIKAYSSRIKRCAKNPERSSCDFLKERFTQFATGFKLPNTDITRFWSLGEMARIQESRQERMMQEMELKLATNRKNIKTHAQAGLHPYGIKKINITYFSENSRIKKLESLIDYSNAIEVDKYGIFIKTDNRFLTCDLLNQDIGLEIVLENDIYHVEKVSEKIQEIGYSIHKKLLKSKIDSVHSKEVQAAYLGYQIGKELEKVSSFKSLNIKQLFIDLVSTEHRNLEVKQYSNSANFFEQVYPDRSFEKRITQTFKAMVK